MSEYVGLDVSMEETSVCITDEAGLTLWEGTAEASSILCWVPGRLVPRRSWRPRYGWKFAK